MGLVKVSQAEGRIPVTVFELQDRVNWEIRQNSNRQVRMPMPAVRVTW